MVKTIKIEWKFIFINAIFNHFLVINKIINNLGIILKNHDYIVKLNKLRYIKRFVSKLENINDEFWYKTKIKQLLLHNNKHVLFE